MPEQRITFKYLGATKGDADLIRHYHLEVTDNRSGKVATIAVEPRHLISAQSMKRILLDRCMFYTTTRKKHEQMLDDLFSSPELTDAEPA